MAMSSRKKWFLVCGAAAIILCAGLLYLLGVFGAIDISGTYEMYFEVEAAHAIPAGVPGTYREGVRLTSPYWITIQKAEGAFVVRAFRDSEAFGEDWVPASFLNTYGVERFGEDGEKLLSCRVRARRTFLRGVLWAKGFTEPLGVYFEKKGVAVIRLGPVLLGIVVAVAVGLTFLRIYRKISRKPQSLPVGALWDSRLGTAIQSPAAVASACGLRESMRILTVGYGPGPYVRTFSRLVGEDGKVVVADVRAGAFRRLAARLDRLGTEHLRNVQVLEVKDNSLSVGMGSFDVALVAAFLISVSQGNAILREIRRTLAPDGVLAVAENVLDPDFHFRSTVIRAVESAGYTVHGMTSGSLAYTMCFGKSIEREA